MGFLSKTAASAVGSQPVGHIGYFGNATIPNGYLPCDGLAVSRAVYATLFAQIGIAFGAGDGSTTFNVPDMRGRTAIGDGTGTGLTARTRGQNLGVETHPLTIAELAAHNHSINDPGHTHLVPTTNGGGGEGGGANAVDYIPAINGTSSTTGISINNNGSGTAHQNMQPSTVVKFGIKYIDSAVYLPSVPTYTKYLSGSGTYNLPAGCRYIRVRMIGAGGGGGGGIGGAGGAGTPGGNTTFGSSFLTAGGGAGGYNAPNSNYGGAGGSPTINSPAVGFGVIGNSGGNTQVDNLAFPAGGMGGAGVFGGGPSGATNGPGQAAQANSGSGGGGGSTTGTASYSGFGGGAGAFIDVMITTPAASYSFQIGSGGAGGTPGAGGTAGGAGGSGFIEITEYYA